jgi:hypothetical protein
MWATIFERASLAIIMFALLAAVEQPAYGYTDPGSGALIWQMLMAALVGVGFYYRRLLSWFKRPKSAEQRKSGN